MRDTEMDGNEREEVEGEVNEEKCNNLVQLCRSLPGVKPLDSTILFSPQSCRRPVEGEGQEGK